MLQLLKIVIRCFFPFLAKSSGSSCKGLGKKSSYLPTRTDPHEKKKAPCQTDFEKSSDVGPCRKQVPWCGGAGKSIGGNVKPSIFQPLHISVNNASMFFLIYSFRTL